MIGKRLAVRGLEALCRVMWGFPPTIISAGRRPHGPAAGDRLVRREHAPLPGLDASCSGRSASTWPASSSSLRNGCVYCAYGHVYALELLYLRQHGRLFPIDASGARRVVRPRRPRPARPPAHRAGEAGLHTEAIWVDRIVALAEGSQTPVDAAEARLAHVIRMADTVSRIAGCGRRRAGRGARPGQQGRRRQGPARRTARRGRDLSRVAAGQEPRASHAWPTSETPSRGGTHATGPEARRGIRRGPGSRRERATGRRGARRATGRGRDPRRAGTGLIHALAVRPPRARALRTAARRLQAGASDAVRRRQPRGLQRGDRRARARLPRGRRRDLRAGQQPRQPVEVVRLRLLLLPRHRVRPRPGLRARAPQRRAARGRRVRPLPPLRTRACATPGSGCGRCG